MTAYILAFALAALAALAGRRHRAADAARLDRRLASLRLEDRP